MRLRVLRVVTLVLVQEVFRQLYQTYVAKTAPQGSLNPDPQREYARQVSARVSARCWVERRIGPYSCGAPRGVARVCERTLGVCCAAQAP